MNRFDEAVAFIENTPRFFADGGRNKSGNDNLKNVMEMLDNPQDRNKCIHIAGTNGKGSTARFVMSILACEGKKVGIFTSPHLVRINERIAVADGVSDERIAVKDITDDEFLSAFNIVMSAVSENVKSGGGYLSYFEMLFAIAAVYFASLDLDYVIYETGLGGRLDATNIVQPEITVITSIGLDHTAYLGDTIPKIAAEKAGIIKEGVPVVYNTGDTDADRVIEEHAARHLSRAINVAKATYKANELSDKTIDFSFRNGYYSYHNIVLNVCGAVYQIYNAATAITAVNILLKTTVREPVIKKAMALFDWPGRMERLSRHIIVDGAHNEDAIKRFAEAVTVINKGGSAILLFAVSADKEYDTMIRHLSCALDLDRVYVTSLATNRGEDAAKVAALFEKYNSGHTYVSVDEDIKTAFNKGTAYAEEKDGILFCVGSLYLVGSVKQICNDYG